MLVRMNTQFFIIIYLALDTQFGIAEGLYIGRPGLLFDP
jgi:hypothetical protein